MHPDTPILVGVGTLTDRLHEIEAQLSPLELLIQASTRAARDAGLDPAALAKLDQVYVVKTFQPHVDNPPRALCAALGADAADAWLTTTGGHTPQMLVNRSADAIAHGRAKLILLAGAEAQATEAQARRLGHALAWSAPSDAPLRVLGEERRGTTKQEHYHGLSIPAFSYPLFEIALRHRYGHTPREHQRVLGELFARFSRVAAAHPDAWFREEKTASEIGEASADNRPIALPYTKRMNAMNGVNQAAAVLMTSVAHARALGIDESRFIHLHGCAEAHDLWHLLERVDYVSSPAIARVGREALTMAEASLDDIAHFDLYSCFPCAVEIARDMLGLAPDDPRELTVTGGLPFHGGPGNDYTMHAIATMARRLRERPDDLGLVTGNGFYLTTHACGVYGARPSPRSARGEPWRRRDPAEYQRELQAMPHPALAEQPGGAARIETYTVIYDREGAPERGIVIGRLDDDRRFVAHTPAERSLLETLIETDAVGAPGRASPGERVNLFVPS